MILRVVGLGSVFEYGARVIYQASPEFFRNRLDFYGGAVASPLVLVVLTPVVAEATAADAVTEENIAATYRDDVVFFCCGLGSSEGAMILEL